MSRDEKYTWAVMKRERERHISTRPAGVDVSKKKKAQTTGINKKSKNNTVLHPSPHFAFLSVLPHTSLTALLLSLVVNSSFLENGLPAHSNRIPPSPNKDFLHREVGQRRTTHIHVCTQTHMHMDTYTYADTRTRKNHKQGHRQGFHFVRKHKLH